MFAVGFLLLWGGKVDNFQGKWFTIISKTVVSA